MAIARGSYFFCPRNETFVKVVGKKKRLNEYRTEVLPPSGEIRSGGIFPEKLILHDLGLTPVAADDRRLHRLKKKLAQKFEAIQSF